MRWLVVMGVASVAAPAAAADCTSLLSAKLPMASVTAASIVPTGTAPLKPAVDVCRVTVTARPSADSDIRIELWIPQGSAWNGKYMQVGNGGFAGQIPYRTMALGLRAGYAVAGTDTGHQTEDAIDARWALGHPEKVVDFGWRSIKATGDAAKALLAAYGTSPKRAYFLGCSDGGREALMAAQRFPQDYDGIVAGAPASHWTQLMASAGLLDRTMSRPKFALTAAKLPALQAAALKACGGGKPWVATPQQCRFDPGVLACKPGTDTAQCLTRTEIATVRMVYRGQRDPATGKQLFGLRPGAEAAWQGWLVPDPGQTNEKGFAPSYFTNLVREDANFKIADLTTADLKKSEVKLAPVLNATSPDLSAFRARGGKLIQYHGWNDPAIPPDYSLAYAASLKAKLGDTRDFYRLYMVPGMLHCGGGASPTRVDWIKPLEAWVEGGSPPGTLNATGAEGATQELPPTP
ncbi:tannase/feruloyl esterase family alpha/beta hydrolase [Glacieibacterium frigidum]|uniref:Tannase/feruloyl esterase family alpha/beta hydrolase n=1 Tax=Glacieibacterium frigidum TaxID=2593303 RepID=A0A552UEM1_9SPHN|nr:tannase/feruloyl esterase family alpha/beta hydrolase [Glacieibacterium frigidum]TRW16676.1 tannase/feruloyl esterase family alpha/beta hydrolase [Glacieibacterium frigidum]